MSYHNDVVNYFRETYFDVSDVRKIVTIGSIFIRSSTFLAHASSNPIFHPTTYLSLLPVPTNSAEPKLQFVSAAANINISRSRETHASDTDSANINLMAGCECTTTWCAFWPDRRRRS